MYSMTDHNKTHKVLLRTTMDQPPPPGNNTSRRQSRRLSILIDNEGRVWAPDRPEGEGGDGSTPGSRKLSHGSVKFQKDGKNGVENIAFVSDSGIVVSRRDSLHQTHIGHDPSIRRKSVAYLKKELEIQYHSEDLDELCKRFNTSITSGLTSALVDQNRVTYGRNQLSPPKRDPLWVKFLKTLVGGFQLLLWVAAILSFIAYLVQIYQMGLDNTPPDNLYLGITIAAVVFLLGIFTFYQEYSSGKVMDSFAKLVPTMATATRDGRIQQIPADQLVVGDIVEIKFGDAIPADVRILECTGFKVDNSSLTGESEPQSRSSQCTDEDPMETKNLAFFSTNALEGTAKGMVVAVGDRTFIGRIADLASGMDEIDTPIAHEVRYFVKIISIVAGLLGGSFFFIALGMGYKVLDAATFLVAIIVANVPEGLLVTFTVILALTAKRMAEKNCVVRQLHAVETLGSCSVICSDKTGTLTQNKMTVSHFWYGNRVVDASADDAGNTPHLQNDPGFMEVARICMLCSRAKFLGGQDDIPISKRTVSGDASESAILRFMESAVGNAERFQQVRKKVFEIPFNSSNKWQLSVHDIDGVFHVEMKGAPERIAALCQKIRVGSQIHPFDENWNAKFNQAYEDLGGLGERVIGMCESVLDSSSYPPGYEFSADDLTFMEKGMVFTGLVSMIDPARPGVPNAVNLCRGAGIQVVMVTGDHPITAKAIARKVNIISEGNLTRSEKAAQLGVDPSSIDPRTCKAIVIPGHELIEMSTAELDDVLENHTEIVFARVSPQQKLVIVEGFQRLGKIVAVTGDGVNDSPALKKADIGVAMGISGSDVSKQAADMILLDDNFNSIVTGVEEGRLIFENLKKCIAYLLCANITTLTPFLLYILIQIPLPLGTIQMLAIVLGTDVLPTISISYEPPEGDMMSKPPRNPETSKLVTPQLILYTYFVIGAVESLAGMFSYMVCLGTMGFTPNMLWGFSVKWDNVNINDLQDAYGQEWSYRQRKRLMWAGWASYVVGCVACQWGNVLIAKCRKAHLFERLFTNNYIWMSIIGETLVAAFLIYTPGFNHCITFTSIQWSIWPTGIPFMFFLMAFDELRRYIIRNKPSWKWWMHEFIY